MQSFNHLITTRPHQVRQVLISDLHLSLEEPALVQAFLALLDDLPTHTERNLEGAKANLYPLMVSKQPGEPIRCLASIR